MRTREITSRSHAVPVAGSPGKTVEHDRSVSPKTSAVSEMRPRETTSRCSRTVPVAGSSKEAVEHDRTVLTIHSNTVRCVVGETSWNKSRPRAGGKGLTWANEHKHAGTLEWTSARRNVAERVTFESLPSTLCQFRTGWSLLEVSAMLGSARTCDLRRPKLTVRNRPLPVPHRLELTRSVSGA